MHERTAEELPPARAALRAQLLATEHWSLLATRSQTWSEVIGRIGGQLTFMSAVLVVLAFTGEAAGRGTGFWWLAAALASAVLVTGVLTMLRVRNASEDDRLLIMAMNRLRSAYVELDPELRTYLTAGWTDDLSGVMRTYSMGVPGRQVSQILGSAQFFMITVNSLVAGAVSALVTVALGGPSALTGAFGVSGAVVFAALTVLRSVQLYRRHEEAFRARFPGDPEDEPSGGR